MSFDATLLANPVIARLRAYDPGHDLPALRKRFGAVLSELGSNENPVGPSAHASLAAARAVNDMWRYPDPVGAALKHALGDRLGVSVDRLVLGNGSHELLMLLAQCFVDGSTSVVYSQYGFAVFPIATAAAGAQGIAVPALPADDPHAPYGHDLAAIKAAIRPDTRLVYLANPNNPTGTSFGDAELETFMAGVREDVLVVVDEAYHEYVDRDGLSTAVHLLDRYLNLVVTRTFSKGYALAGLRVGYLIADPSIGQVLERLRESFNVNGVALAAAEAALADEAHMARVREQNLIDRTWLAAELTARGYRALPSQTNFLLVDVGGDAVALESRLFERGVIVRPMGGYGLGHTVRISVGSRRELECLLEHLP
jgi:histidinol-phosphate aminotransferase